MFHRILFWSLLPIAAAQGLSLRKKAMRLEPPPGNTFGLFGQQSHNRFSKPLKLLALGDSIIAGIGATDQNQSLTAQFAKALAQCYEQPVSWKALGNSGANSLDLLAQLSNLQGEPPPDLVLISIGVNDVTGLHSSRRWHRGFSNLCEQLGARWPAARIVFCGLPPMGKFPLPPQPLRFCLGLRAAYFDRIAVDLVDKQAAMLHIPVLVDPAEHDFCPDGFHPSDSAYASWGEEMASLVSHTYPTIRRNPVP